MSVASYFRQLDWAKWFHPIITTVISAAASPIAANPIALVLGAQQFTLRQLGIMSAAAALSAMAGVLVKSPWPDRRVDIALVSGVHTVEQVEKIFKATAPCTVPTPAVAAAIIAEPASGVGPDTVKPPNIP